MYSSLAHNLKFSRTPVHLACRLIRGKPAIRAEKKSYALVETKDFFGIESGEGLIAVDQEGASLIPATQKYKFLVESENWNEETLHQTNWGQIRLDVVNKAQIHGQFEEVVKDFDINKYKPIYVDDKIIDHLCQKIASNDVNSSSPSNEPETNLDEYLQSADDHNLDTKSYIKPRKPRTRQKQKSDDIKVEHATPQISELQSNVKLDVTTAKSPIESEFQADITKQTDFKQNIITTPKAKIEIIRNLESTSPLKPLVNKNVKNTEKQTKINHQIPLESSQLDDNIIPKESNKPQRTKTTLQTQNIAKEEKLKKLKQTSKIIKLDVPMKENVIKKSAMDLTKTNIKGPISAYEYLMQNNEKNRLEKGKQNENVLKIMKPETLLDSKGFLLLKNQVPNLVKVPREILLHSLKASVVYDNFDIVALDKPYGMLCDARNTNAYLPDIYELADDLAKVISPRVESPKLYPLHRLDRDTTGVFLFARSKARYDQIKTMFKENKVKKTYWLITKGIPEPYSGTIDIPIVEGTIHDKYRMVLHPKGEEIQQFVRSSPNASRAVTTFQVLTSANGAALVEACPETGVKHQLRVHFGFGMMCPILGDHKYSSLTKIVPQRLPPAMLLALGVRQSKVRTIPLSLHAKSIVLPEIEQGRNIFIQAQLPYHFRKNMKALKLVPKKL